VIERPLRSLHKYQAEKKKESRQDRAARRTTYATIAIAVFTAVTTVVSGLQWTALHSTDSNIAGQLTVMRGQLDEIRTERRPWVSIDTIEISEPLSFDSGKGASMRVNYVLRNTGKTPAVHVKWRANLFIVAMRKWLSEEINDAEDNVCMDTAQSGPEDSLFESIIFPSDRVRDSWPMGLDADRLKQGLRNRETGPFAHNGYVSMAVVVCVDYQIAPREHRQTRGGAQLGIPISDGGMMGDFTPEGTRPDIRIVGWHQAAD
jgi:hypothetical protein